MKRILSLAAALLLAALPAFAQIADPRPVGPVIGLCQGGAAVAHTGDTVEFTHATCSIPRKYLGPNGRIIVRVAFSHTNSANNKTMRVRLNGIAGTAYLSQVDTTTAAFNARVHVGNRNATNSQAGYVEGSTAAVTTSAVDTTVAVPLVITGQLALGTETLTLESWSVQVVPSK
jgi:hypothetical protein